MLKFYRSVQDVELRCDKPGCVTCGQHVSIDECLPEKLALKDNKLLNSIRAVTARELIEGEDFRYIKDDEGNVVGFNNIYEFDGNAYDRARVHDVFRKHNTRMSVLARLQKKLKASRANKPSVAAGGGTHEKAAAGDEEELRGGGAAGDEELRGGGAACDEELPSPMSADAAFWEIPPTTTKKTKALGNKKGKALGNKKRAAGGMPPL